MRKRKINVLLLSATIMVGMIGTTVVSCGSGSTEETPSEVTKNIESVTIKGYDDTTVLDGSIVTLKAEVKAIDETKDYSNKVTWKSSDETIATVKNGAVTFKTVTEDKDVTITATSVEDDTKASSVKFTVKHAPIDIYNSKGQELDTSMFLEDGTVTVAPGDVALISADAYGTKFYYEAEIQIDSIAETENYPKIGIMVADNGDGNWCGQGDGIASGFFYLDAIKSNLSAGVSTYGFVASDEVNANWDWGKKPTTDFNAGKSVKMGVKFKMGLLRNGTQYILYVENAETGAMEAVRSLTWNGIAGDQEAHTWIGGFNTGMTVGGFKSYKGDAVDALFKDPTTITTNGNQTLYIGDTFQTEYKLDSNAYDFSKLTFTSSDTTVATVSETGLVTATEKPGTTTISVNYGSVSGSYSVTVTDDPSVKVVLDGKRDDIIWEKAKEKPIYLNRDNNNFEDFYAVKTSRGVYISADLFTKEVHNTSTNWWQGDNFEFKLSADEGATWTGQLWFSSVAGNSNMKDVACTSYTETKGMHVVSIEALIPYSTIGETANIESKIIAGNGFGANPGGAGWHAFGENHEITTEGFADGAKHDCSGGHTVCQTEIVTPSTCVDVGAGREYCRYCDWTNEIEIPVSGHKAKEDTITVTRAATADNYTEYSAECETCGQTYTYEDDRCANILEAPIAHNHNAGGWDDRNIWSDVLVNKTGDFKYRVDAHMEGGGTKADENYAADANCWKTLLPVIYATDEDNNLLDSATFRLDWFGWMNDRNGDGAQIAVAQDNGLSWCDWANEIATAVKDAEVAFVFERKGNDLYIDSSVYSNTYEKQYGTMRQKLTGLNYETISVAFSSEFTVATIKEVYKVR